MCNIERQINTKCQGFACCFAYSKNRSTVEIVLVLVNVFLVVHDWATRLGAAIYVGDVATAFDTCPIISCAHAMFAQGVEPESIAAYMKEQIALHMQVSFCGINVESPFVGALKQGGRDGPKVWNILCRWLLHMIGEGWKHEGLGFHFEHIVFTHACWSDNIVIAAKNVQELKRMVATLTLLLISHNMSWKAKDCQCLLAGNAEGEMAYKPDGTTVFTFGDGSDDLCVPLVRNVTLLGASISSS